MKATDIRWHNVLISAICGIAGGIIAFQISVALSSSGTVTAERFILLDPNGQQCGQWEASLGIPIFSMHCPDDGEMRIFTKESGAAIQFGRSGKPEMYFEHTRNGLMTWAKLEGNKMTFYEFVTKKSNTFTNEFE